MGTGMVRNATPTGSTGQSLGGCCSRRERDRIRWAQERTLRAPKSFHMTGETMRPSCLATLVPRPKDRCAVGAAGDLRDACAW